MEAIILDSQDLNNQILRLIQIEPQFAEAYKATGKITQRRQPDGHASIIRTIVGQQVSVASANAIWNRVCEAGFDNLEVIQQQTDEQLREVGLSRQKASYLKALASANINFSAIANQSNEQVIKTLTAVKGIGNWTAEIYLMFALQRADVTASNDLALQEGAKLLFELDQRPNELSFKRIAENWSPYRNAASQLLWAYYHVIKDRDGIGI